MSPQPSGRALLVIPTLGTRTALLGQTLESLLGQSVRPDVAVVAPAGARAARDLARDAGARIVDDPGIGMTAAINAGWALAAESHEFVNWIGDDDLLAPDALAVTTEALDRDPGAVVAFGHCDYIDDEGRLLWTSRAGRLAPWLMTWGPDLVPQPGALFRLSAVRRVGFLDPTLHYAMDLDLFLRLRRVGKFVNTGRTLAYFRWHPDSATVANRTASLDESQAVKRRYYGPAQRRLALLWERPVRGATRLAARRLNRVARSKATSATAR